ncbi:DUF3261 domain-containing protein [Cupriavidus basilensis]|uniref:DUF3261 domain-containing protein n=1 Tax=Cupriavidus basilensis TaxID=68895 RepID=UPI0020C6497A|nr:DUF3261 domain-containing protein [Cupriavidus basilensis]
MRSLIARHHCIGAAPARMLLGVAACALLLAGCAGPGAVPAAGSALPPAAPTLPAEQQPVPLLRLPPASLGRELALAQQITVVYRTPSGEERREIQALLDADATHTRLAALAGGQVLARLDWDGQDLRVVRSPWAPAELVPERILSEMQLSLWPVEAIAAALPAGWRLEVEAGRRVLRAGGEVVAEVRYPDPQTIEFEQYRDGYRLTIRTLPPAGQGGTK